MLIFQFFNLMCCSYRRYACWNILEKKRQEKQEEAASKLQHFWYFHYERKLHLEAYYQQLESTYRQFYAARNIQRCWRNYFQAQQEKQQQEREQAALCIQSAFRRHLALIFFRNVR